MSEHPITKIYFVWNADKSLKGAVLGMIEVMRGIDSCSLCDITYNGLTPKPEWINYKAKLESQHQVDITEYYRNKLPDTLAGFIRGKFPAIIGERADGALLRLLSPSAIDECAGDLDQFMEVLDAELDYQATEQ
ncbi:hypothetical protein [Parvularcula sp. IMCC14364]|uniref:hypothetical protein n=1 Tax=Parvularcula sp. IMCC14364 TaxID=3067902 RepID=UPI0027415C67|nr:hypothetical protein [Parvularcula sp. IMCC14364]